MWSFCVSAIVIYGNNNNNNSSGHFPLTLFLHYLISYTVKCRHPPSTWRYLIQDIFAPSSVVHLLNAHTSSQCCLLFNNSSPFTCKIVFGDIFTPIYVKLGTVFVRLYFIFIFWQRRLGHYQLIKWRTEIIECTVSDFRRVGGDYSRRWGDWWEDVISYET